MTQTATSRPGPDGLTATQREAIRAVLRQFREVERAILLGSRAIGTWRPASDIDLALLGDTLTLEIEHRIAACLDDLLLPVPVDLLRFHTIQSEPLRDHITTCGVPFYPV